MSWNFRVMRNGRHPEEVTYGIHEVYYTDNGDINGWSMNPSAIETSETPDALRWFLEEMTKAMDKPILDYETGKGVKV